VLPMAAGELGNPLARAVELEADDRMLHAVRVRRDKTAPSPTSD
jgi:hypothetical protein